jgi:hypothetical protein
MATLAASMRNATSGSTRTTSSRVFEGIPIEAYFASLTHSQKQERHELYRKIYNRLGSAQFTNWNKHIIILSTCTNEQMQEYYEQLGTLIMAYHDQNKALAIKRGFASFTKEHVDEKEIMTVKYTTYHPEGTLFTGAEYIPISVVEYMKRNNVYTIEEKNIDNVISREFDSAETAFPVPKESSSHTRTHAHVGGERKYPSRFDSVETSTRPVPAFRVREPVAVPSAHAVSAAPVAPTPPAPTQPTPPSPSGTIVQTVNMIVIDPYSGRPMLMTMPSNGVVIHAPFGSPLIAPSRVGFNVQVPMHMNMPIYENRQYIARHYRRKY